MLSQVAQSHAFYGWVISHCVCMPHLLSLFVYQRICRLISFSVGRYPEVELRDSMLFLFVIFFPRNLCSDSTVAALITNPPKSVKWFPFLHILTNTCYFLCFWYQPFYFEVTYYGLYSQLIYIKGDKNIQWEKQSLWWYWENQIATCKSMNLYHFLTFDRKKTLKMD